MSMLKRHLWMTWSCCTSSALGCAPASDLDAHARGRDMTTEQRSALPAEAVPTSTAPGAPPPTSAPAGIVENLVPADVDNGLAGQLPDAGRSVPIPDGDAGPPLAAPGDPTLGPTPPLPQIPAPDLPNDLRGAPVAGEITFSDEATWEVDGVFQPTFEIHTPTGSYWVVKHLGSIVSIEDGEADAAQWIDFSSGFRPLRGVPRFAEPPVVSTLRDDLSQTPTHVRLTSESADALWHWVWDFYVTHVTLTVNRAPAPFGFAYQGVPGGSLGAEDRLVTSDGVSQGARNSFQGDLPGPVEWAYLADTLLARSLFVVQHVDDVLPEAYQVRDNDTSFLSLGNGRQQSLPQRFSLGMIGSVEHAVVSGRVEFVAQAIR
jgi:hypothetical protein